MSVVFSLLEGTPISDPNLFASAVRPKRILGVDKLRSARTLGKTARNMAALPNLSALSLDSHDTEATGVRGEQCDPTKRHKSSTRCVRMRLHPGVFAALKEHPQFDPQK